MDTEIVVPFAYARAKKPFFTETGLSSRDQRAIYFGLLAVNDDSL